MIKKYLILTIFILLFSSCSFFSEENKQTKQSGENLFDTNQKIEKKEKNETALSSEEKKSKISMLKKRIRLKGLISSGDMHSKEDNYFAAILTYKKALKDIPNDKKLIHKIADVYYEMKNFSKANAYYVKLQGYEKLSSHRAIMSLINAKGIHPGNIDKLKTDITNLKLDEETTFYYKTSLDCIIDFSKCREEFQTYFSIKENLTNKDLANIKRAFENFKNFNHDELYYKASFISGAFYENAFYFLSLKTAEKVLSEKRDYKPMLKVAAKSAYEVGNYELAKDYLLQNKKIDSHDYEVSYFLARVYEKLNDIPLAIVHYQKSLKDGNPDVGDIYRRLIFIYFSQDNMDKMLIEFDNLMGINHKDITETDFLLTIYYNILNDNLLKAKKYTMKAIRAFPKNETFYAYLSWILLDSETVGKTTIKIAENNINKAYKLNNKSPSVLMVKGILDFKKGDYAKSIIHLKSASGLDTSGEYREEINFWLEKVKLEQKKQEK